MTLPIVFSLFKIDRYALQVSITKFKSLVGVKAPKCIFSFPVQIWVIIVGITALQLCLGPYVLNGLIIEMGVLKLCQ